MQKIMCIFLFIFPRCIICKEGWKKKSKIIDNIFLHCSFTLLHWHKLFREVELLQVIPDSWISLFYEKHCAFGGGKEYGNSWNVVCWLLRGALDRNWIEYEDFKNNNNNNNCGRNHSGLYHPPNFLGYY